MSFSYRLHDTEGDDLGLLLHPVPNVEADDEVTLADGRTGVVTRRTTCCKGTYSVVFGPVLVVLGVVIGTVANIAASG